MSTIVRQARREDVIAMHHVRLSVRENRLTSTVLANADYVAAIEETGRGWVAEIGDEIVGFAIANSRDGTIWALFVEPDYEGRGYGRQLHDVAVGWLWSKGRRLIRLTTESGSRAQRFYEAAGWTYAGMTERGERQYELRHHPRSTVTPEFTPE